MNPGRSKARRVAGRRVPPRRTRGAALVEAAVVIPTLLVFLGLIMYVHKGYATKMDKQFGTRSGTLYYASHNCDGTAPDATVPIVEDADPNAGDPAQQKADKAAGKLDANERAGIDRSLNLVRAKPADTQLSPTHVVRDGQSYFLSRKIKAASEVACNERRYDNPWTSVFQFIVSYARSGGGFVD